MRWRSVPWRMSATLVSASPLGALPALTCSQLRARTASRGDIGGLAYGGLVVLLLAVSPQAATPRHNATPASRRKARRRLFAARLPLLRPRACAPPAPQASWADFVPGPPSPAQNTRLRGGGCERGARERIMRAKGWGALTLDPSCGRPDRAEPLARPTYPSPGLSGSKEGRSAQVTSDRSIRGHPGVSHGKRRFRCAGLRFASHRRVYLHIGHRQCREHGWNRDPLEDEGFGQRQDDLQPGVAEQ